jgi:quercetin dioxygenase-like cupin family protein
MYKINVDEIPERGINRKYMEGVSVRYLIVEEFGAPNFELRYFELEKGSVSSLDRHPYEHEVFVIKGSGTLELEGTAYDLREGDAVLIEPNERHQLMQRGEETFGFLCIVPNGVSRSKKQAVLDY